MYWCHCTFNLVGMSPKSSFIHCYLKKRHCPSAMLSYHKNTCTTGIMWPNNFWYNDFVLDWLFWNQKCDEWAGHDTLDTKAAPDSPKPELRQSSIIGDETQPQGCSAPEHNFSTPKHEIQTVCLVCSLLKTWNNKLLIMKLAILAMETSTTEHFSNPKKEI